MKLAAVSSIAAGILQVDTARSLLAALLASSFMKVDSLTHHGYG